MPRSVTLLTLFALLVGLPAAQAQDEFIVGNGDGFVEATHPTQPPCPDAGDPGCDLGLGNTVFNDPNVTDDFYYSSNGTAVIGGTIERLYRYIETLQGEAIMIRWTAEGSYGLQFPATSPIDLSTLPVVRVPFELWAVGPDPNDDSDDVRMIPWLHVDAGGVGGPDLGLVHDWTEFGADPFVGFADDGSNLPATNPIYMMLPDRPDGYDLFEAAAIASGGPGADYTDTDVDVMPIDASRLDVGDISPASGNPCVHQGGYVSWCWRNDRISGIATTPNPYGGYFGVGDPDPAIDPDMLFVYPIGRTQVVDNDPDGAPEESLPPTGSVHMIYTPGALRGCA